MTGDRSDAALTVGQQERILARRAEELARAPEPAVDSIEVLVFALGDDRYAFATQQVREVRPLDEIAALPGAPAFVAGLVNVRGRVVPVLDLRPLFGTAGGSGASHSVLLLASPWGDVGMLATDRPSVVRIPEAELGSLPAGAPPGLEPSLVRGVTPDLVVVLDAQRLLNDRRLRVEEIS